MFIKIVYSNGYCGCEEEIFLEATDDKDAENQFQEGIEYYSFFWPDSRFVDDECDDDQINEYQEGIYDYSYWEEISEEEYKEHLEWQRAH